MENQKRILERIFLPSRIVVHRLDLTTEALAEILRTGALDAAGEHSCDLEVGGRTLARGRIVRRRGEYYLRVLQIGEEES